MKKVEVEKLVSKAIIITALILCTMFGTWLIQQGYFNYTTALTMPNLMIGLSMTFALGAVAFIVFGILKSNKFYKYASYSGILAILFMLLKINYEIKALEFVVAGTMIKFFPLVLCILLLTALVYWIFTIVKIVRN